jgi:hypothetical protein
MVRTIDLGDFDSFIIHSLNKSIIAISFIIASPRLFANPDPGKGGFDLVLMKVLPA